MNVELTVTNNGLARMINGLMDASNGFTHMINELTFTSSQFTYLINGLTFTSNGLPYTINELTFTSNGLPYTINELTFTSNGLAHTKAKNEGIRQINLMANASVAPMMGKIKEYVSYVLLLHSYYFYDTVFLMYWLDGNFLSNLKVFVHW
jgi:hypothetical protein